MLNETRMGDRDAGYALAANVADVKYEDIAPGVVEVTKKSILDTLGTIIAGSGAGAGIKQVVELVKQGGGREESTVIGYGVKVPCWMAAFANGAMAHSLDYDNGNEEAGVHNSITTLPAALAIAERVGRVNGKEFIAAITVSDDLICRMSYAKTVAGYPAGTWNTAVTMGVFSAAAVSGRLLGLNGDQILDALGIAVNHAGGTFELVYGLGSVLRGMYACFPAITGVLSALMAQQGIIGTRSCLEGNAGFYKMYYGGKYDRSSLTSDLGKVFLGAGTSFKPWPCCRWTHTYIDATLQIVREHDIYPENVEEVTVFVGDLAKALCEPLEVRRKPTTPMEAKFSLPFTVATAIARRNVVIRDFLPDGLKDPASLQLAQRVTPKYAPELKSPLSAQPARVDIKTKDGKLHSKQVDIAYGNPQNPISWEELLEKFRDCAKYSANPISTADVERVIQMVTKLEDINDMSEIISLVS